MQNLDIGASHLLRCEPKDSKPEVSSSIPCSYEVLASAKIVSKSF